jgi:pimeloyl-ACP methyl ester carboxylesterase
MFSAYTAFGAEFTNRHLDVVNQEIDRRSKRWKTMSPAEKAGIQAQIRAAMTHDAADLLAKIKAPTLVTVGSSDEVTRPEYAREIAELIPGARMVVFPGGPHRTSTFMAEEFNRVTLAFLLEQPPGADLSRPTLSKQE